MLLLGKVVELLLLGVVGEGSGGSNLGGCGNNELVFVVGVEIVEHGDADVVPVRIRFEVVLVDAVVAVDDVDGGCEGVGEGVDDPGDDADRRTGLAVETADNHSRRRASRCVTVADDKVGD